MAWSVDGFDSVQALTGRLLRWSQSQPHALYRGQPKQWPHLIPSIARTLPTGTPYATGLRCETELLDKFCIAAREFMSASERALLERAQSGAEQLAALSVMQHYGVPTRLLDWTSSPWVAAYFACIHSQRSDGEIWMFDNEVLTAAADRQWDELGVSRQSDGAVDLHTSAFRDPPQMWIASMRLPLPFARIEAQQGCFTVAGDWSANHDEVIEELVPRGTYWRIVIPSSIKPAVLRELRRMNVHSASILYPGADMLGHALRSEPLDTLIS